MDYFKNLKEGRDLFFLFFLLGVFFLFGCSQSNNKVLFQDDFNYPDGDLPDMYWTEGSDRVKVLDNHLYINATPETGGKEEVTSTVWLNKVFKGNIHISYDAHIVSSPGNKNNLNFFLFFSGDKDIYDSREERNGIYHDYHEFNGYIFTYVANGKPNTARFRLRDDPGFNLLDEYYGYECKIGKTYHIEIKKKNNRLTYLVDGTPYLDVVDNQFSPPHNKGLIGFRTWRTKLWIDNLKITKNSNIQ